MYVEKFGYRMLFYSLAQTVDHLFLLKMIDQLQMLDELVKTVQPLLHFLVDLRYTYYKLVYHLF